MALKVGDSWLEDIASVKREVMHHFKQALDEP